MRKPVIGIVYSKLDVAGANMVEHLVKGYGFEAADAVSHAKYQNDLARIYEIDVFPFQADFVDSFGCETIVFLSRHKSEAGVASFTTHSLGNWRDSADFGGAPKRLSFAAPVLMRFTLEELSKIEVSAEKTYEATHHGPLLKTPSLFVELGGSDEMIASREGAAKVADAAYGAISSFAEADAESGRVVIGIGSNHYPEKFSRLALEKGYAFSHIMPKYAILNDGGGNNLDVLAQALTNSAPEPEAAVVDWKSLNSLMKEETLKKLDEIGLDHEKA